MRVFRCLVGWLWMVMIWSYSLYEQEGSRRLFCSNGFDVFFRSRLR
jgi:hypothetical protein